MQTNTWMPTSRERLVLHMLHAHLDEDDDHLLDSKSDLSHYHRTDWPTCPWSANRPDTQPKTRNFRR